MQSTPSYDSTQHQQYNMNTTYKLKFIYFGLSRYLKGLVVNLVLLVVIIPIMKLKTTWLLIAPNKYKDSSFLCFHHGKKSKEYNTSVEFVEYGGQNNVQTTHTQHKSENHCVGFISTPY